MEKSYQQHPTEKEIYQKWEKENAFSPSQKGKVFSIVIPPPNVTGILHIGHALNNSLQDILIRFARLQGMDTLWVPGTDHAGIATQNVLERILMEEGKTRHMLGREAFIQRTQEWTEKSREQIVAQLKAMGVSCDWGKQAYTLDEVRTQAVKTAFIRLFNKGFIYRGYRIIHWCPRCTTALSDIEVEHKEIHGKLYTVKYPGKKVSGFVCVATTRPETILGDVAVAVHPSDERYSTWVGRTVLLPIPGVYRELPIIADEAVDPEFGTGALKITPAHDPVDYEIGLRHHLPSIQALNEHARISSDFPAYAGLDRFEAREKVVDALQQAGLLMKVEPYLHAVGHCQRCGIMVEPRLSRQWFLSMKPLAKKALDALDSGKGPAFIPASWTKVYRTWLEEIRDWCISRQLWWGHPIPAYFCSSCQQYTAAESQPARCPHCEATSLTPDPDVLDTWFSSALWPLSVFGWPKETDDLKRYYPTSILVTAFDILFFWVARMVMFGLEFTHTVPFKEVYIHGLIRDIQGRKMSKSAGNVVDPMKVIQDYGADSLRFAFAYTISEGQDILLSEDKLEGARRFLNKLWNASRLILLNLPPDFVDGQHITQAEYEWIDRWIWTRLCQVSSEVQQKMALYDFQGVTHLLYDFIWGEFCDWYLEAVKVRYYSSNPEKKRVVLRISVKVLRYLLQLLHPFAPFITEKIWTFFPDSPSSLITSTWKHPEPLLDEQANKRALALFQAFEESVRAIRKFKKITGRAVEESIEVWQVSLPVELLELVPALSKTTFLTGDSPPWPETVHLTVRYDPVSGPPQFIRYYFEKPDRAVLEKRLEEKRKEMSLREGRIQGLRDKLKETEVSGKIPEDVQQKWRAKLQNEETRKQLDEEELIYLRQFL